MPGNTKVSRVFISHGHNEALKLKLRIFVKERLGLEAVILAEQPDDGLTVIEKLEKYGRSCSFALILLTADDQGATGTGRARQNVIHELGYFHGVLGRKRVLLLKEDGVELFSNISGLIYKDFRPGAIESVFEDVRLALQSGNASDYAKSVPLKVDVGNVFDAALTSHAGKMLDKLCEDLTRIANSSRDPEEATLFIRSFIQSEKQDAEEAIASCEQTTRDSKKSGSKDPDKALGVAFEIVAFGRIIGDMRMKKRAMEAILKEMDVLPASEIPMQELLTKLQRIAGIYLR